MAINFPNSPSPNQLYSYDNKTWEWNGQFWEVYSALTSYITSATSVGNGQSVIENVSGGTIYLNSLSGGTNIQINANNGVITISSVGSKPEGSSGISGLSGISGVSGLLGFSGTSGISGISGQSGTSGISGISGQSGTSGISGISGQSGNSGTSGISGLSGVIGSSGISGISGLSGIEGLLGSSGTSGISGLSGISGETGQIGISGLQGISGISGISPTNISTITFTVDTGGAAPISSGLKSFVYLPFSGTILSWTILSNISGSTQLDIYKTQYNNYPPSSGDTIITTDYPELNSQIKNQSSVLTGWTSTFDADDVLGLYVVSAQTITRVQLILKIQK